MIIQPIAKDTKPSESRIKALLDEMTIPYSVKAALSRVTWFRTGGVADYLVEPQSSEDLAMLLQALPADIPVTVIGAGSNLLVRDGGVSGIVIRFGKGMASLMRHGDMIVAEAGVQDIHLARQAADWGLAGLEFLVGIPGTVGGALAMNSGAYGAEIKDIFQSAKAVDLAGTQMTLGYEDFDFGYRSSGLPQGLLITEVTLKGRPGDPDSIHNRLAQIRAEREAAQPIGVRTGGSTFKNPAEKRAWELVDAAGCRGLTIGGAQMSEKHCNFMINTGNATGADLETLGETVRERVLDATGVQLEWEIKRIGVTRAGEEERAHG